MIKGVQIVSLKKIPDERGMVMHMLRRDDPHFQQFGEIYFSLLYPGIIKGWHFHKKMTLNYAVVSGMIKLVLYDDRPRSPTRGEIQELFVGEAQYALVQIPPKVWNGCKGIGLAPALIANCATHPHDPTEIVRRSPFDPAIPYTWEVQHR